MWPTTQPPPFHSCPMHNAPTPRTPAPTCQGEAGRHRQAARLGGHALAAGALCGRASGGDVRLLRDGLRAVRQRGARACRSGGRRLCEPAVLPIKPHTPPAAHTRSTHRRWLTRSAAKSSVPSSTALSCGPGSPRLPPPERCSREARQAAVGGGGRSAARRQRHAAAAALRRRRRRRRRRHTAAIDRAPLSKRLAAPQRRLELTNARLAVLRLGLCPARAILAAQAHGRHPQTFLARC